MDDKEKLFHITRTRNIRANALLELRHQHEELLAQAKDVLERARAINAELFVLNHIIEEMGGRSTANDLQV